MKKIAILPFFAGALACSLPFAAPAPLAAQTTGVIVEDIVARVNDQIITLSDYQKAQQDLAQEAQQDCQGCTPDRVQAEVRDKQKDLLRDLIDQQLLVERAKDMDVNVEADVVKRLDEVRKQNNLASLEDLQKAVESQGIPWEDYKTQIRNHLLTQQVISHEVGSRMDIGSNEVKQYYEAHKQDFVRPEQVALQEIFLGTDGKTPEETAEVQAKAEDLHARLVKGDDFTQLAKKYSQGSTSQDGGELGVFEHGQLAPQLEAVVFKMDKSQYTDVIQTKTGFEILRVGDHFQAGQQPLDKVEGEIQNRIYMQKMDPALRKYLAELREESYVTVKAGYTDSAAVPGATAIQEVAPTPDDADKKKAKKKISAPKING
jgi:peptidyl-prolyl cis-trans isomerase SurA